MTKRIGIKFHLPLEEMTTAEKLELMEELWQDLCRNPESIPSPDWHRDVLAARERKVAEGSAHFSSLEEVKERVRKAGVILREFCK